MNQKHAKLFFISLGYCLILLGFFVPVEHRSHIRHSHEYIETYYFGVQSTAFRIIGISSTLIVLISFVQEKIIAATFFWLILLFSVAILWFYVTIGLLDFGQSFTIFLDKGYSIVLIGGITIVFTCGFFIHASKGIDSRK